MGLFPGIGNVADGINTLIYLGEKDYANALLSATSMIPFLGILSGGTKIVKTGVKVSTKADNLAKEVKGVGGAGSAIREQLLNKVENPKLKNAINEIYRPGANVGDGGLADAIRYELSTGELVGGKSHIQKAMERVINLENIIKKQELSSEDLEIANKLLEDLQNALGRK